MAAGPGRTLPLCPVSPRMGREPSTHRGMQTACAGPGGTAGGSGAASPSAPCGWHSGSCQQPPCAVGRRDVSPQEPPPHRDRNPLGHSVSLTGLDYPMCDTNTSVWPHARTQPSLSQLWFGSSWCQQGDRTGPQTSVGEGEGFVPCLRLILGEMQAAQLLHPHVGVSQLCHVVTQGQDAVGTTRKGHIKPGRICCAGARNSRQWPG